MSFHFHEEDIPEPWNWRRLYELEELDGVEIQVSYHTILNKQDHEKVRQVAEEMLKLAFEKLKNEDILRN